jgi:hypothetical protein
LKEDDASYVAEYIQEHAIAIWHGKIYNLYQECVLEQSHAAFYALCIKHKFSQLQDEQIIYINSRISTLKRFPLL